MSNKNNLKQNAMATVNGVTCTILAELSLANIAPQNFKYVSTLILKRPNGTKKFNAIRKTDGTIELL